MSGTDKKVIYEELKGDLRTGSRLCVVAEDLLHQSFSLGLVSRDVSVLRKDLSGLVVHYSDIVRAV